MRTTVFPEKLDVMGFSLSVKGWRFLLALFVLAMHFATRANGRTITVFYVRLCQSAERVGKKMRWLFGLLVAVCFVVSACPDGSKTQESTTELIPDGGSVEKSVVEQTAEQVAEEAGQEISPEVMAEVSPETTAGSTIPKLEAPTITLPATGPDIIQIQPALAVGLGGGLAMSYTAAQNDKKLGIFFQRIGADGKADGTFVRLDTFSGGNKTESSICALKNGGYVVVWSMDTGVQDPQNGNLQVRFRLVGEDGQPVGAESTQVKTDKAGNHWLGRVTCLEDGGFAVAGVFPDDAMTFGAFFQRYDAQGKPVGAYVQTNTQTDGNQAYPMIAAGSSGLLGVVWEHGSSGEQPILRLFSAQPITPEILLPKPISMQGSSPNLVISPDTEDVLVVHRQASAPFVLHLYDKTGGGPKELSFPDAGATNYAVPSLLAFGKETFVIAYLKGPNNNDASATVAVIGPDGVKQQAFSIARGRIPLLYRPALAYTKGKLFVAYTERTDVQGGLTIKLAMFQQ